MTLQIISPEGIILLVKKINRITLPGSAGIFTVLHNHAPLLSSLIKGVITYGSSAEMIEINGGVVEVKDNIVSVYI